MSRTDAHRPMWVRELDPTERHNFRISHHHQVRDHWDHELRRHLVVRVVPCDYHRYDPKRGVFTRCWPMYVGWRRICSCNLCGNQPARRQARRQERYQARRFTRLARALVDRDDLDEPLIRGKAW